MHELIGCTTDQRCWHPDHALFFDFNCKCNGTLEFPKRSYDNVNALPQVPLSTLMVRLAAGLIPMLIVAVLKRSVDVRLPDHEEHSLLQHWIVLQLFLIAAASLVIKEKNVILELILCLSSLP